jgi:hypothetical protein
LKEENGFQALADLVARVTHPKVKHFAKIALEGSIEYLDRNAVAGDQPLDELEG